MTKTYHVVIEQDEDGVYVGKVMELQGCVSQGETLDELVKNIREAAQLCVEVYAEEVRIPNELAKNYKLKNGEGVIAKPDADGIKLVVSGV